MLQRLTKVKLVEIRVVLKLYQLHIESRLMAFTS